MSVWVLALLACVTAILSGCSRSRFTCSWPVDAPRITQDYGCYACTYPAQYHSGIDLTSALDPPGSTRSRVFAAASGRVVLAQERCPAEGEPACGRGLGNHLVIGHNNGYATLYAHLAKLNVAAGDTVERGALIAIMGSSGNASGVHLHFDLLSFTPAALDEIGPRYTENYPAENGHLDPKAFVSHRLVEISAGAAPVLERPPGYYLPSPGIITTLESGQRFVSLAEYNGTWHYISLPSPKGPAEPPRSPLAAYGWVESARVADPHGVALCAVTDHGKGFVPVYAAQEGSELTRIWDGQRYALRPETGGDSSNGSEWFRLDLPANARAREGWVYGKHVRQEEQKKPGR
jgi:murein DD-endopeptidase MepM/ murein hydrolase activator NlpD